MLMANCAAEGLGRPPPGGDRDHAAGGKCACTPSCSSGSPETRHLEWGCGEAMALAILGLCHPPASWWQR